MILTSLKENGPEKSRPFKKDNILMHFRPHEVLHPVLASMPYDLI